MKKKNFACPVVDVVVFNENQIISCSGPTPTPINPQSGFTDITDSVEKF